MEPEPVKVDAGLQQAQADVDKMQSIIEPRQNYQLSQVGILDTYVPARRIEVLTGATTLASIIISGLEFFKIRQITGCWEK